MKFYHVYNDEHFKGLEINGLINKDTGFKLQHDFPVPFDLKFNVYAAKGTKLYNYIKDNKFPFYVDRICGGTTWHDYVFDKSLVEEYRNMLGNDFLGFQLHESGSNRRFAEWPRMIKAMGGSKGPYDLKELSERMITSKQTLPDGTKLHRFSQDNVYYYANKVYAETWQEFTEEMKEMFTRRIKDTYDNVLPCDSYFLATKLQNDLGMRTFMPEVGCQIPWMRIAVALARGMALANGKTWGTYYECWREHDPSTYSMPCFNSDPSNEWYLSQEQHGDDFTTFGENGGSSRLLQNRIYYYSLMSGADYMAEEWGLNCSYSDMNSYDLSTYGLVKKNFIKTAENYRGVKAVTPFAIVLPKKYSCVELVLTKEAAKEAVVGKHRDVYMGSPLNAEEKAYFGHVEDVIKLIFNHAGETYGNESHTITNSKFPDVFDIIYEDCSEETFAKYEYLIDATKDSDFKNAKKDSKYKIIESCDLDKFEYELKTLIKEVMPCYVDGLHWLVSYDENGKRFLTIFNNEGNTRSHEYGDIIDHKADAVVTLTFKDTTVPKIVKENPNTIRLKKIDDKTYSVKVLATGFGIIEF